MMAITSWAWTPPMPPPIHVLWLSALDEWAGVDSRDRRRLGVGAVDEVVGVDDDV